MGQFATHFVDYSIFLVYSVLLWQALSCWFHMNRLKDKRKESLLNALVIVLIISILAFVGANAYMLTYRGETLLTIRMFQVFVMANFFVYWLILALLRKEAVDGDSA